MKIRKPVSLNQYKVSSPFGVIRMLPGYVVPRKHYGIDIEMPIGSPILSVTNGEIIQVEHNNHGFGNFIVQYARHEGDDYYFFYCHLSEVLVQKGVIPYPGMVVGLSGESGTATGPHLHFQVTKNGYLAKDYDTIMVDPNTLFISDFELVDYKDHPHCEAIQFVKETGLMTGRSEIVFDPDAPLTRAEFAVVMKRLFEMKGVR